MVGIGLFADYGVLVWLLTELFAPFFVYIFAFIACLFWFGVRLCLVVICEFLVFGL